MASNSSDPHVGYFGRKQWNDTHEATTDLAVRLHHKSNGVEATLSYLGHLSKESLNGTVVSVRLALATGKARRRRCAGDDGGVA